MSDIAHVEKMETKREGFVEDSPRVRLEWLSVEAGQGASMFTQKILLCEAGQVIARIVRPTAETPADAKDALLGNVRLGKYVEQEGEVYKAQKAGHVLLTDNRLRVEDMMDFEEDVSINWGEINYPGKVKVYHSVLDSVHMTVGEDLMVNGSIEAAEVLAGGGIQVGRGICGKEKGRVRAGNGVSARFITNAQVKAGGDVVVENEIANSTMVLQGVLKIERGAIMGGHVLAQKGILCHTAGSPAGVVTVLEVGLSSEQTQTLRQMLASVEATKMRSKKIREAIQPLMADQKKLTAAQKEKATELLFAADEADAQAMEALEAVRPVTEQLQMCMRTPIRVASILHAGVVLRYPTAEARVERDIKGPVTVGYIYRNGQPHITVADDVRGTGVVLSTMENPNDQDGMMHRLLDLEAK